MSMFASIKKRLLGDWELPTICGVPRVISHLSSLSGVLRVVREAFPPVSTVEFVSPKDPALVKLLRERASRGSGLQTHIYRFDSGSSLMDEIIQIAAKTPREAFSVEFSVYVDGRCMLEAPDLDVSDELYLSAEISPEKVDMFHRVAQP